MSSRGVCVSVCREMCGCSVCVLCLDGWVDGCACLSERERENDVCILVCEARRLWITRHLPRLASHHDAPITFVQPEDEDEDLAEAREEEEERELRALARSRWQPSTATTAQGEKGEEEEQALPFDD